MILLQDFLLLCNLSAVAVKQNKIKTKSYLDRKLELVVNLRHQEIMAQSLPHFHDPHNGSIDLVLTILKDPFRCARLLLHLGQNRNCRD